MKRVPAGDDDELPEEFGICSSRKAASVMTMNCRKNLEYAVAGKQPRANRPASMGRGRLQRQQTLVHLDDVVGQTVGRDGSLVQKNGAVAVLRDLGHVMGHHKDGFTGSPKISDAV